MKKLFFTFNFVLLFLIALQVNLQAQMACYGDVSISLDSDGSITIIPEMFLVSGSQGNEEFSINGTDFYSELTMSCDDIGESILVTLKNPVSGVTCETNLTVEDKLPPYIQCVNLSTVVLEANNELMLFAIDFFSDFSDNCTVDSGMKFTFGLTPESDPDFVAQNNSSSMVFTSEDAANSPIDVEIWAWDENGNSNSCTVLLNVVYSNSMSCGDISVSLDEAGIAVVSPAFFLESPVLGTEKISKNGIDFYPELTFDCSEIGVHQITVKDTVNGNYCWSSLTIENKLLPSIVCPADITVSCGDDYNDLEITGAAQVLTNCQPLLASYEDGIINFSSEGAFVVRRWRVVETPQVFCDQRIDFGIDGVEPFEGDITWPDTVTMDCIWPVDIGEPVLVSNSCMVQVINTRDSFLLADNELKIIVHWSVIDWISYEANFPNEDPNNNDVQDGIWTYDQVIIVHDNTPPVVVVYQNVKVHLSNGIAKLFAQTIDNASYDACSEIELSIGQTSDFSEATPFLSFSNDDIGNVIVFLFVEDEFGHYNSQWTTIEVIGSGTVNGCAFNEDDITWPLDISSEPCTVDYGSPVWTPISCALLGSSKTTKTFQLGNGEIEIIVYWVVIDWNSYEANFPIEDPNNNGIQDGIWKHDQHVTVIDDVPPVVVLDVERAVYLLPNVNDTSVVIAALFLDEGSYDACGDISILIDRFPSDGVANATESIAFTNADIGINEVVLYVVDLSGNVNTGFSTITILTGGVSSPEELICDTLPRGADVGSCDDGHTLDDQIEWPNDLDIYDFRISPIEMVAYGSVDPLDAQPSFYTGTNPNPYSATFYDNFYSIDSESLIMIRKWTVTHENYNFEWKYSQELTIFWTEYENSVVVTTPSGRVVPDVVINDDLQTNENGVVELEEGKVESISLADNSKNGVNVLDIVLLRKHILNSEILDEKQLHAADLNNDNKVNTLDIILTQRMIISDVNYGTDYWIFIDELPEDNSIVKPKGKYLAVKLGDINDSASLGNGVGQQTPVNTMLFEDILMNAGESYSIPVKFESKMTSGGLELKFKIDRDKIDITDVSMSIDPNLSTSNWMVSASGVFTLVITNPSLEFWNLGGVENAPVLTLDVSAKENTVLSDVIETNGYQSYSINENFELEVLDGNLVDKITTRVEATAINGVSIYPNPVSTNLIIDMTNASVNGDMEITIFEMSGKSVLKAYNENIINVSSLNNGLYMVKIMVNGNNYTQKINILK